LNQASQPTASNQKRETDWLSALQFGLSVLAIVILLSLGLIMALVGLVDLSTQPTSSGSALPMLLLAAAFTACGLLLIPSAGYAYLSTTGKPRSHRLLEYRWLNPRLLIFALPFVLLTGHWASGSGGAALLVLPVLHVLAVGLPAWWFTYLGVRDLPLGSPQRMWGVFGSGLVLGPFLIMLAELAALFVFVFLGAIYIANQPELLADVESLMEWLLSNKPSPEMIVEKIGPYLLRPVVLFGVFVFGALIVPMIEEAIKPIGVWLLAGRAISPAGGFAAGVLSGAGYALFESLMLTSGGEEWAVVVLARIGTAVIHILTTGLMGLALVLAWRNGKYLHLGLTYLGVVAIHGLWNGLTLFALVTTGLDEFSGGVEIPSLMLRLGALAPYGLAALSTGAFIALIWVNRSLAKSKVGDVDHDFAFESKYRP